MTQYLGAPGVYLWSSCLILAGNTAAPMCLRGVVRVMYTCAEPLRLDRSVCMRARVRCLPPCSLPPSESSLAPPCMSTCACLL